MNTAPTSPAGAAGSANAPHGAASSQRERLAHRLATEALGEADAERLLQLVAAALPSAASLDLLWLDAAGKPRLLASTHDVPWSTTAPLQLDVPNDGRPQRLSTGDAPTGDRAVTDGVAVALPGSIGVLVAYTTGDTAFDADDLDLLEHIAPQLALALRGSLDDRAVERDRQLLGLLLDEALAAVWTTDTDLRVRWARGHAIEIDEDTGQGPAVFDFVAADADLDAAKAAEAAHRSALAGNVVRYTLAWDNRWWGVQLQPYRSPTGTIDGTLGFALNVTEQRDVLDQLHQSRARLQALVNHALDAILIADDTARYVDANPAALDLLGYPRDELLQLRVPDVAADIAPETVDSHWQQFLEAGRMEGTYRLRRKDGRIIEADYRAVANFQPGLHLSILRDVTAQRHAEQAVAASEERFRNIAANVDDVIFRYRLHPDAGFEYVSPAITRLTGVTPEQLYEDRCRLTGAIHRHDRALLRLSHPDRAASTDPVVARIHRPDGTTIWIEERHVPVYDDHGTLVAVDGIARDVTAARKLEQHLRDTLEREQQATDQLRHINALKDTFIQAISHELRTPLTTVIGFSQVIRTRHAELSTAQLEHYLDRLEDNAARLQRLLTDLLDIDRIERGIDQPLRTPTDIGNLLRDVQARLDDHTHPIVIDGPELVADIDSPRVERIVEHLLANAIRHTDPGTPIAIRYHPHRDGLQLLVEDHGPGIPDNLHDDLFAAFRQGDTPANRTGGAGIGLAVVARFAELHGGYAEATNRPDGGARFTVHLPAATRPLWPEPRPE